MKGVKRDDTYRAAGFLVAANDSFRKSEDLALAYADSGTRLESTPCTSASAEEAKDATRAKENNIAV